MKTIAFVPIKMNNERLPGKNIKAFEDGTPLIHFIQRALKEAEEVDEIYVYCSREEIREYLIPGVKYLKRDEKYDTAQANVNDMFYAFSQAVTADIYVLAHATAPFQTAASIDKGILAVKSGEYDSAIAVRRLHEFIWRDGMAINYDTLHIPRTQDLPLIYAETTGLYVYTRNVIDKRRSRIGAHPFMLEMSIIEAIDINEPMDFDIASAIYSTLLQPGGVRL